MPRGFLPATDAGLLAWTVNFRTLISAQPVLYGLTAPMAASYGATSTAYEEAYQTAIDPITRTRGKVAAKDAARAALRHSARLLAKIVEGTASVTDEQKIDLGLNVRAMPTPIPAPAFAPALDIVSSSGYTVRLKLHDSTSSTRRGRAPGTSGAAVFSFVGANPPTSEDAWRFEGNTTRTTIEILFASTVAPGSKVWFTAFWFNPRAQRGPASTPVGTNLPGGSAMAA